MDKTVSDPFTDRFFATLDPAIRSSLTPGQRAAIHAALHRPGQTRMVRGLFPVYFRRYFFVLFWGRDRRPATLLAEQRRRYISQTLTGIGFFMLFFVPLLLLVAIFLYIIKVALGIDIFPGRHIWEILLNR